MERPDFSVDDEGYWEKKYERLLSDIKQEFPNFAIIPKKTSKFSQMLGRLTFWNKDFNRTYSTTIGPKIYTSEVWKDHPAMKRFATMVHERIHMRQTQKYGFLAFFAVFGLIPLPAKIAYFRRKWEWEAYKVGICVRFLKGGREAVLDPKYIKYLLDQFCGAFYLWTWHSRKAIVKDLLRVLRALERNTLTWEKIIHQRRLPWGVKPLKAPLLLRLLYPAEMQ